MSWEITIKLQLGTLALDVDVRGESGLVALIGPNGSGKTTLLRTIAGAHCPDAGQIRLGEQTVFDSAQGLNRPPEARRVGYVPQGYGLFPHLSVLDNVGFGSTKKAGLQARRQAAAQLLERMGCAHLADGFPAALSGGEQQRVALARALMIDPQILLLDEPLAALDASARRRMRTYLANHLAERAGPAIVVTHDVRDVLALNAHVYVIEAGKIVQHGTPQALMSQPATDFVAEFLNADAPLQPTTPQNGL